MKHQLWGKPAPSPTSCLSQVWRTSWNLAGDILPSVVCPPAMACVSSHEWAFWTYSLKAQLVFAFKRPNHYFGCLPAFGSQAPWFMCLHIAPKQPQCLYVHTTTRQQLWSSTARRHACLPALLGLEKHNTLPAGCSPLPLSFSSRWAALTGSLWRFTTADRSTRLLRHRISTLPVSQTFTPGTVLPPGRNTPVSASHLLRFHFLRSAPGFTVCPPASHLHVIFCTRTHGTDFNDTFAYFGPGAGLAQKFPHRFHIWWLTAPPFSRTLRTPCSIFTL